MKGYRVKGFWSTIIIHISGQHIISLCCTLATFSQYSPRGGRTGLAFGELWSLITFLKRASGKVLIQHPSFTYLRRLLAVTGFSTHVLANFNTTLRFENFSHATSFIGAMNPGIRIEIAEEQRTVRKKPQVQL